MAAPGNLTRLDSDAVISLDSSVAAAAAESRTTSASLGETGRPSQVSIFMSKVRRAVSVPGLGIKRSFRMGKKRAHSTEHATVEPISLEFDVAHLEEDYRADQEKHIIQTLNRWFVLIAVAALPFALGYAIIGKFNNAFAFFAAAVVSFVAWRALRQACPRISHRL